MNESQIYHVGDATQGDEEDEAQLLSAFRKIAALLTFVIVIVVIVLLLLLLLLSLLQEHGRATARAVGHCAAGGDGDHGRQARRHGDSR